MPPDTAEPRIITKDKIAPHYDWDRAIPAPGHSGVDFEERVNFRRLHDYRLGRARQSLQTSGFGALLCFDNNNIRYLTSTVIGEWSRDKMCRYALLAGDLLPRSECLRDVVWRMLPYWYDAIVPDLAVGRTVLVVAHGNSLRALVKHLDGISDAEIPALNIPTGIPLVYELDERYLPVTKGGRYLDPEAAKAAAEAVANQGR